MYATKLPNHGDQKLKSKALKTRITKKKLDRNGCDKKEK